MSSMRSPDQTVHSRAHAGLRCAMFPLEGYPPSKLPTWPQAEAYVLVSPAIGAAFVQHLIDLPAGQSGGWPAHGEIETFHFVMSGDGRYESTSNQHALAPGGFGLTPPGEAFTITADSDMRLLVLRKKYEPSEQHPTARGLHGNESGVTKEVWADNPDSLLQTLIPDDPAFDLAMNIFTFQPGCGLPIVETHVMEHGLYYLQGRGLYFLEDRWMEVEKDDFIWMGPYCPQSFMAAGPSPSRYLYYKNVNRDITL